MVGAPSAALAEVQREAAHAALHSAFGGQRTEAITRVTGGASGAATFRAEISGRRYLVRVEGHPSPLRNPHQYVSMRIATAAGIAPRIHHIDEGARVAVMDFIEERPLGDYPGGPTALARALGETLARLHATPSFPQFVEYPDIVGRLWAHVCRTGLFAPTVLDGITERLALIHATYAWDSAASVSSHNDPVPRNILFDGERLWLVDWESAYRNDPLVDVAIMLDNLAPTPALESILLAAWLGRAPDASLHARLSSIRALTRLYYAGVLLSASAAAGRDVPDGDLAAPTLQAFQRAVREGRLRPGAVETKHVLGKMYLAAFATGGVPPGLNAAV